MASVNGQGATLPGSPMIGVPPRSASRQMEMAASQTAPAEFGEEVVKRLMQPAGKQAWTNLHRMR